MTCEADQEAITDLVLSARRCLEFINQCAVENVPGCKRDGVDWAVDLVRRMSEIPLQGDSLLLVGSRQNKRLVIHNDRIDTRTGIEPEPAGPKPGPNQPDQAGNITDIDP